MIELRNITQKYGSLTVYSDFLSLWRRKKSPVSSVQALRQDDALEYARGAAAFFGNDRTDAAVLLYFPAAALVPNLTVSGNLRLVCRDAARCGYAGSRWPQG